MEAKKENQPLTAPAPQQTESIHCREFHELAMDYRAAHPFCAHESYDKLVVYVNSRLAKAAPAAPVQTDLKARQRVAKALGLQGGTDGKYSFAWEYLLGCIEECAKEADDVAAPVQAEQAAAVRAAMLKEVMDLCQDQFDFYKKNDRLDLGGAADAILGRIRHIATKEAAIQAPSEDPKSAQLRRAVETVCEGWTLPSDARKVLESALWTDPSHTDNNNED